MSGVDHLRAVARGIRPAGDGLLGNARCAWGDGERLGEEAILAGFTARPFDLAGELLSVETPQGAALIGKDRALVADLYDGRIGRLWHVGDVPQSHERAIDVAFDADMSQQRVDVHFRAEDHPDLDPAAAQPLLTACRGLIERVRVDGKLRVRGFIVRAFGGPQGGAALMSLFTLDNEARRSASFSYSVVGVGADSGEAHAVHSHPQARDWTPRF